jgi:phosphoserine aminotransferase
MGVKMKKNYNFSAAASMLADEVRTALSEAILNYNGTGRSITEISHNTQEYNEILSSAEASLRKLLSIPQGFRVLFLSGGSDEQYSAIPLNLLSGHKCADYVLTGRLSKSASIEAKKYGEIAIAGSSAGASPAYSTIPDLQPKHFRPDADYIYICYNNTYYGTKFPKIPDTNNIPLVADMSSFLLSEPIDVSRFSLIYASCDACLGISGMTIVIVRDDFCAGAMKGTPSSLDYKLLADPQSTLLRASVVSVYTAKLVFEWLESLGGLEEVKRRNERKAALLYDYLDAQSYYTAPVHKKCRSLMNVIFVTGDSSIDRKFAEGAAQMGIHNIAGDPSVGGMCASIYTAMPVEGVEALVSYMRSFSQQTPKIEA